MRRKLKKYEEGGGNPQEQNQQGDVVSQIAQMLQQGGNPMDVVMGLMQQQMAPEQIVQILVQAGLPQEQAMQSVQQVMQQSQGQGQPQQGQPEGQAPTQEQVMMEFGGEFKKQFNKKLSDKLALPSSTTEDYTNERFKVFSEAVRRNFAKSVVDGQDTFEPMYKAELGLDVALSDLGLTKDTYDKDGTVKAKVDSYLASINQKPISSPNVNTSSTSGASSFQERNGIIYDNQGNPVGLPFRSNQNQNQGMFYNQGNQQLPFYGYQDPRFQTPQMSPFLRLLEQNANRNYRLKNIQYNGVPTDLDMTGVLAGTNPNYTIDRYETFKNRKGLFRKEKGIRFYLNPKDGSVQVGNQNPTNPSNQNSAGPGFEGFNADANGDGVPDYLSQGTTEQINTNGEKDYSQMSEIEKLNYDALARQEEANRFNPNMQPNWQDQTGQEMPQDLMNQFMGKVTIPERQLAVNNYPQNTDQSVFGNYPTLDGNAPINENINASAEIQPQDIYSPEFRQKEKERDELLRKQIASMRVPFRGNLPSDNTLNAINAEYNAELNRGMVDKNAASFPMTTVDSIDPSSPADMSGFQNVISNPTEKPVFQNEDDYYNYAYKTQGIKPSFRKGTNFVEGYMYADGTPVAYDKEKRTFIPKQAYGGDVNRYKQNMFKAVDGMDMDNGEFVDYTFDREKLNRGDIADFSKNTADQIAYFAEMARNFASKRDRENAFFSSANEVPRSMMEMSRGLYTDQGDFIPTDLGNQVLNPTSAFGDNSMNYMMGDGGGVGNPPLNKQDYMDFIDKNVYADIIYDQQGNPQVSTSYNKNVPLPQGFSMDDLYTAIIEGPDGKPQVSKSYNWKKLGQQVNVNNRKDYIDFIDKNVYATTIEGPDGTPQISTSYNKNVSFPEGFDMNNLYTSLFYDEQGNPQVSKSYNWNNAPFTIKKLGGAVKSYMMANGGDVSFTQEELDVLKKAGYNLK